VREVEEAGMMSKLKGIIRTMALARCWHHEQLLVDFYTVIVSRWQQREGSPYAPSEAPTR